MHFQSQEGFNEKSTDFPFTIEFNSGHDQLPVTSAHHTNTIIPKN